MHRRRSRTLRTTWWLIALLLLLNPAASAVADAHALAAGGAATQVHLEEGRCAPSHPANCAHCLFSRDFGRLPEVARVPLLATVSEQPSPRATPAPVVALSLVTPLPRAPPALPRPSRRTA